MRSYSRDEMLTQVHRLGWLRFVGLKVFGVALLIFT